jgi:sigma-B regulation protein RsbU (phosphoserine phosphatase)
MKRTSLSYHIIKNVLLFCIALFLVIFSVYYYFARKTIREDTRENSVYLAKTTINKIEQVLTLAEKNPQIIAKMLEASFVSKDSLVPFLKSMLSVNDNLYGSIIAFEPYYYPEQGMYYAPYVYRQDDSICTSILGDRNYEYFYMDWYQIPKITNKPYWSEPYFDEGGGNVLMTTYSVPFYKDVNGAKIFSGVVTIDITLKWLTEIITEVKILESGYAFLLSRNGVVISHPNSEYIMNQTIFTIAKENNQPGMRDTGRRMIRGESSFQAAEFRSAWRPGKLWINYAPLPSSKWSMGIIYPEKEMFASLHRMNFILLVLIIIGLTSLSVVIFKIVSKLTSPLKDFADSARLIASGNFNVRLPEIKTEDEMKELYNSFSFMQKELDEYMATLKETTSAKEKIESELRIANEIQMSMIPHIFPPFPDLSQIDLFATLKSAKEVGGDLYDFFVIEGNKFCFAIGDVSGKGVPASLFMAVTRTLVRSISDNVHSPSAIVESLNRSISQNNDSNMFVTLFLGVLDLKTGELLYTNAGHNPPVLIRKNGETFMFEKTKFIPAGLFEDFKYGESSLKLESGDKLFLYTDGVSEAENAQGDLFGEHSVMQIINNNINARPQELINIMGNEISAHVNGYTQSDDITMMTIVYNG